MAGAPCAVAASSPRIGLSADADSLMRYHDEAIKRIDMQSKNLIKPSLQQ
jgi:hypothetical protein